jgi:hypothetical protein
MRAGYRQRRAATFGTFDGATSSYGVMAVASVFGVIAVALPFFYLNGTAALVTSLVLALGLGIAIAQRRSPDLGRRKAYLLTFGVLAIAIGVTSAVSVLLPGSGG